LDREAGENVSGVEGEIHKRTGISSIRLRQKIIMEVDALDYATGGVLSMKYEDGKWRLIAFFLKSVNETERNYETHNKKMLVVIRRQKNWRHLLECTKFKFEVWTNDKNLKYLIKVQKLNRRQVQ